MFCTNCGSSISGDSEFCSSCGNQVTQPINTENKLNSEQQEYNFYKSKGIGRGVYKQIYTNVKCTDTNINIARKAVHFYFFKGKPENTYLKTDQIQSIGIVRTMDFWDTLYGIIFIIIGFLQPYLFILAVLCLWCAYGKKVRMTLKNGTNFDIQANFSKEAVNFVEYVNNGIRALIN